jgi:hypothetical protein
VGVPRLVAIEHPFGQIMGRPGDSDRQLAVLLGALEAILQMDSPGSIMHLPFEWNGSEQEARSLPPVPPPIASYLKWHPWLLPRLFARDIPAAHLAREVQ